MSLAAPRHRISLMAANEGKAEVKTAGNHDFEGPESVNSGRLVGASVDELWLGDITFSHWETVHEIVVDHP